MSENSITLPSQVTGPEAPQPESEPAPEIRKEFADQPEETLQPTQPEVTNNSPLSELETKTQEAKELLGTSGIDYTVLEDEYAENGEISEAHYDALEKAGYPRRVVDTYIAGLTADITKAQVVIDKEVENIKASVGGDEPYSRLTQWAAKHLSEDDINGFNGIMATNNVSAMKMAVQMLQSRYEAAMGKDPQYLNSQGSAPAPRDVYNSWHEVSRDMADPRYAKDHAFNQKVVQKLSRSPI